MSTARIRTQRGSHYTDGARRLRAWIDNRGGMSDAAFAKSIGRSPSTLCRWLHGDLRIDIDTALAVERITGIPVSAWRDGSSKKRHVAA